MKEIKRDKRKNLKISESLHYNIKELAKERNTTMSRVLRALVVNELTKGKGKNDKEG